MKNTFETLMEALSADPRLVVDGRLAKNKVVELALHLDKQLLKILKDSAELRTVFFQQVDDFLVFDKVKFQAYISNKQFLPDSYTAYKNKIGLTSNRQYLTDCDEVVIDFPYKDCVLEGGQTKDEAKRAEIFWNESLATDEIDRLLKPKVLSNAKRHTQQGTSDVFEITEDDNLIIKGNNLIALHSLYEKFKRQVQVIYIAPPFYFQDSKQGDSFVYNSSFKLSTWLTFLTNRLRIAKGFLKPSGFFFLQIDDEGYPYARLLMDEIFGKENFVNTIHVKTLDPSGFRSTAEGLFKSTNQILMYGKNREAALKNLQPVFIEKDYDDMYSWYLLNRNAKYSEWKWVSIKEHLSLIHI